MLLSLNKLFYFYFISMPLTSCSMTTIEVMDARAVHSGKECKPEKVNYGVLLPNTAVVFEKAEGSAIHLIGKAKGKVVRQSIINPDWDFSKMGVGGLDKEFNAIFRRAFASRVFPPEVMEQLGCKHVKGRQIVCIEKFCCYSLCAFDRYFYLEFTLILTMVN